MYDNYLNKSQKKLDIDIVITFLYIHTYTRFAPEKI